MELGIEGIEIEDNIPLTKEDQADMFIDFLPELPPDEGISYVSFYIEDDGSVTLSLNEMPLVEKIETLAKEIYRASSVEFTFQAHKHHQYKFPYHFFLTTASPLGSFLSPVLSVGRFLVLKPLLAVASFTRKVEEPPPSRLIASYTLYIWKIWASRA